MEQGEVARLTEEVARLTKRVSALETVLRAQIETAQPPPPVEAPPSPAEALPVPSSVPQPTRLTPPSMAIVERPDLEAEIGGNWLARIAVVAIVLAVAWFLKYAIDNRWVNETGRVMIGIIVGLAFLYGGEHFQKRRMPKYAQGITGAGIAILYFSIYAAFAFYSLIPQIPAFAFMVVVTITAIALSVRHDAVSIAILGIMGGFLTPILMRNPSPGAGDSDIRLFTYIAILDLGILGITYYKNWRTLNLLSLAGTVCVFTGWASDNYTSAKLGATMVFLTAFYLIFAAQSFVQNVIVRRTMNPADILMVTAAPLLYFCTSYSLLTENYHIYLGLFAVAMGAAYLLFSQRVRIADYEDRKLRFLFLAIAAAFLIIAIPIQLKQRWITIGWSAEAAVISAIGFYVDSRRTRMIGAALLGLIAFRLLFLDAPVRYGEVVVPFFNARFATFLFSIAMASVVVWFYYRYREVINEGEKELQVGMILGANFLMLWALSLEVVAAVELSNHEGWANVNADSLALSGLWALYAVAMLAVGIVSGFRPARIAAIALLGIVIAKSFLYDVWTLENLYRIVAFAGLGVVLLAASYVYQVRRRKLLDTLEADNAS